MTKQEYLQLIAQSALVQSLDAKTKKAIEMAEESEMDRLIAVVIGSEKYVEKAREEMAKKNEEALKKFSTEVSTIRKEKNKNDEVQSKKDDTKQTSSLLEELDSLSN